MDRRSEYSESKRFLIAFIGGGAIGAALAMVCAPRVANLRRRVSASTADLDDKATQTPRAVSGPLTGEVDDLAAKGQSVRDDVAAAIVDGARPVDQFATAAPTVAAGRESS